MSAVNIDTKNGAVELECQRLRELVKRLEQASAEAQKTIADLKEECECYRKAVLAMSRARVTADELVQWSQVDTEEGLTFEEMMAEITKQESK